MDDLFRMMPHAKSDSKMQKKESLFAVNEIAEMKNCSRVLLVEGRRQMKRDESRQFELEVKLYNQTIEQMEGALAAYRSKISEANSTLR